MPNYSDNKCKIILVGNARVGKTALLKRLIGIGFSDSYEPTIMIDFALLRKESTQFQISDFSGDKKSKSLIKSLYKSASIIVYALDSTEDTEENKRTFLEFKEEISSIYPISNCLQMIVFY